MHDRHKYRAWDTEDKVMIYDIGITWMAEHENEICYLDDRQQKRYIITQCTGLRDKNETLIYEGDALKTGKIIHGVPEAFGVEWCYFYAGWCLSGDDTISKDIAKKTERIEAWRTK